MSFYIVKNNKAKAVYADDLEGFLKKIKMLIKFKSGNVKCRYCKSKISRGNLYMLIPIKQHFEFSCDCPMCINKAIEESN